MNTTHRTRTGKLATKLIIEFFFQEGVKSGERMEETFNFILFYYILIFRAVLLNCVQLGSIQCWGLGLDLPGINPKLLEIHPRTISFISVVVL